MDLNLIEFRCISEGGDHVGKIILSNCTSSENLFLPSFPLSFFLSFFPSLRLSINAMRTALTFPIFTWSATRVFVGYNISSIAHPISCILCRDIGLSRGKRFSAALRCRHRILLESFSHRALFVSTSLPSRLRGFDCTGYLVSLEFYLVYLPGDKVLLLPVFREFYCFCWKWKWKRISPSTFFPPQVCYSFRISILTIFLMREFAGKNFNLIEEEIVRKLVFFLSLRTNFSDDRTLSHFFFLFNIWYSINPSVLRDQGSFQGDDVRDEKKKEKWIRFLSYRLNETWFRGWLSRSCEERSSICKERCSISWLTAYFSRLCASRNTGALALSFHAISFSSDLLPEKLVPPLRIIFFKSSLK